MSDRPPAVSEEILNNMGDLGGYLSGQNYTTAPVALNPDGTIYREDSGETSFVDIGARAVPHDDPGVVTQSGAGLVSPPRPAQPAQPVVTAEMYNAALAQAQRMSDAALAASRAKIDAEDRIFLGQVDNAYNNGEISEAERKALILERYVAQLDQANQGLSGELSRREMGEHAQEQAVFKLHTANVLALQNGLPWWELTDQAKAAIMKAEDRAEMISIIGALKSGGRRNGAPASRAANAANVLTAAPGRGAPGAPRQIRRGDMGSYLKSKPYQWSTHDR